MPTTLPVIGMRRPIVDQIVPFKGSCPPFGDAPHPPTALQNPCMSLKPLLLVDVDGVISLFGFPSDERPAGDWLLVDGLPHLLSSAAAEHLLFLARDFELVWCTGWEEKANEVLPGALGLPGPLPYLSFDRNPGRGHGHWKLAAIDAHAGPTRPLAWIDDALDAACEAWASARPGPTLLVPTASHVGIASGHVAKLTAWARAL